MAILKQIHLFCLSMLMCMQLSAGIQPTDEGFGHEAYVSPIEGEIILKAIEKEPPETILERAPPNSNDNATWIPGYWNWSPISNDFIWISGVWRVPPPSQTWTPGKWIKQEHGWVWLRGYWSSYIANSIEYIHKTPPEPIEEEVQPKEGDEYWLPGYWNYLTDEQRYDWVHGQWEPFEEAWVFVPAHYIWTEKGYLFIPGYWDWPLENRGKAYSAVKIDERSRQGMVVYEPMLLLNPSEFIKRLSLAYPDYVYLIDHYDQFHNNFWAGVAPIWWQWSTWASLTWRNQWALWWWYTHPGYPQPVWLTKEWTDRINPPSSKLLELMQHVVAPVNVTNNGVISVEELMRLIHLSGVPVIPAGSKIDKELEDTVKVPVVILYPAGKLKSGSTTQLEKPIRFSDEAFYKKKPEASRNIKHVMLPPKPVAVPATESDDDDEPKRPVPQPVYKAYDWRDRPDIDKQEPIKKQSAPQQPQQQQINQHPQQQPVPQYPPHLVPRRLPAPPHIIRTIPS